jgi:hypothetical protein
MLAWYHDSGTRFFPDRNESCRWDATVNYLSARELGAILWCAERFPEVQP